MDANSVLLTQGGRRSGKTFYKELFYFIASVKNSSKFCDASGIFMTILKIWNFLEHSEILGMFKKNLECLESYGYNISEFLNSPIIINPEHTYKYEICP